MKKTNDIFKKLFYSNLKYKWYKNTDFIKDFILLYKNCYLLSVSKMSSSKKHFNLQNKLMYIIKKTYLCM